MVLGQAVQGTVDPTWDHVSGGTDLEGGGGESYEGDSIVSLSSRIFCYISDTILVYLT